ncbi:MAG: hypothetical protein ACT443_14955 [Gemmatimonadota bacterium]
MSHRLRRSAVLAVSGLLLTVVTAGAQAPSEKAALKRINPTTSSESARSALAAALEEVENIGGGRRYDAKLKAVLEADPQFALGRAYYATWASTLSAADRMEELDRALRDAVSASTPELLFVAALREWRAGRAEAAWALLDVVRKHLPDDPHVTWARLVMTPAAEGVEIGEDAVKRFPDYAANYNILAYRLNTLGRTDEALRVVQKYVELMPNHPNPHDSYAEILQLNGRLDEAAAHYAHALQIDPGYEVGHEGMAEIAHLRGDYAAARQHLAVGMSLVATPGRRIAYLRNTGHIYLFEGKLKEARQQIGLAIQEAASASLENVSEQDHRLLAFVSALEGKTAEAVEHYNASAMPNPGPSAPLRDALFHGVLGHPADVALAVKALEANAAANPNAMNVNEAASVAKLIHATLTRDLAAARAEQQKLTTPLMKAFAGMFMTRALARAGDKAGAQAALADVEAYKALNANAALTRLFAKRKK